MVPRKLLFCMVLSALLIPWRSDGKDLLPKPPSLPAPPKAAPPKPADLKETAPKFPVATPERPVIESHRVRNVRAVPGGEEAEVVVAGKSLHRMTSARVMQGVMEARGIQVFQGPRTPTRWTLRLRGKGAALGRRDLRLQLTGAGQRLEVPLGAELRKARSLAGLKEWKETPLPISPGAQRELGAAKERESALQTARPLSGDTRIIQVSPSRGIAGTMVRVQGTNFLSGPPATSLCIKGTTYARNMVILAWSDADISAQIPADAPEEVLEISVWTGGLGCRHSPGIPLSPFPISNTVRFSVQRGPFQEAVAGSARQVDRVPGVSDAEIDSERATALLPGGPGTPPPPETGCESNPEQPDMTANPRWLSSSVRRGGEAQLAVSVDAETGYITVVMHHTQFEGGRWVATGGLGSATVPSGRASTASVSLRIRTDLPAGDYFPTITLCRTMGECTSPTGMNISYAGPSRTVTAGINYTRVHNVGFTNVGNAPSCYAIPIVRVTE